ncbi:MMPL family transporter [Mycolicibacterium brumae]|uniref:MMPL family transporter n=1 Tax=Mycolicibacterium brumae TaxID=85968 RepID=A0A2G5PEM7_9MYCO|nr:MMPL family transporter [Mycolicibacterium brumae]MCV7192041.1 MMPL family transporter [Mycolicibacterium brumae]PIB76756.1 MMPL family transporter [Mycolicibacterium brumae]RWA20708.1 hypothetical protein MBRU_03350 [Mycolicibacterium brumae DSM 44177]UWW07806.1 MMPL family transporter [Mycolicibacterium brumae]
MLNRITRLALSAPKRVIAGALLLFVAAAAFGFPVAKSLSAGGFQDPTAPSGNATRILSETFGQTDMQLLFVVSGPGGLADENVRAVAGDIMTAMKENGHAHNIESPWTSPHPMNGTLVSADGNSALILASMDGGENLAQRYAQQIVDHVNADILPKHPDVTALAGGAAMVYAQITAQTERDLLLMEAIALPLSFVVLVWVFGGLLAASIPLAVGGLAIVASMAVLRLITFATDVSIFALTLTTAMGLALAIDSTLLIVSRYRDEINAGEPMERALHRTMATAGRTVLFSATTVGLSMAALVFFPMYFLRSFAYAGVAVAVFAALASIVVTPAVIVLMGKRLDALDMRKLLRRLFRRPPAVVQPVDQMFFYRSSRLVMRHAIPVGIVGVLFLVFLGLPFLHVKWGFPDDRVLPKGATAHEVGDVLRDQFPAHSPNSIIIVVPDATELQAADLELYASRVSSTIDGITSVSAPTGMFVGGLRTAPPSAPTGFAGGKAYLTAASSAPLFSQQSEDQLDAIRAITPPNDVPVQITGTAQVNRDSVDAITSRLPLVLGLIAVVTFVLLFLLTGSVVLPLKALVLNVLSLSAAFGALVWIFQDGHLGAMGTTPNGILVANMPVLLFCIAFGLAMDYEVFLLSRIREFWLAGKGTDADNSAAVALGLARTGRVITAAALVMSITFAALIAAKVSFMRMFGVGLTLAILVDVTLVRAVLVPSFMQVMGKWNWWAPAPMARLHQRWGFSEEGFIPAKPKVKTKPKASAPETSSS